MTTDLSSPYQTQEQECWNLPGFQSLYHNPNHNVPMNEFSPWEKLYREENNGVQAQKEASTLHIEPSHLSLGFSPKADIEGLSNVESFVRNMLTNLSEHISHVSIRSYLRNRLGDYYLVLHSRGNLFISEKNVKLEGQRGKLFISCAEKGEYTVFQNGMEAVFPLLSRSGLMGILVFSKKEGSIEKEMAKYLWQEICKYGKSLFQFCIYEKFSVDQETTLLNSIRFQEDLLREMACQREKKTSTHLVLLQWENFLSQKLSLFFGQTLRQYFPFPERSYRIGTKLCAVLVSQKKIEEMHMRLIEFFTAISKEVSLDLSLGASTLKYDMESPQEWFYQAQNHLKKI